MPKFKLFLFIVCLGFAVFKTPAQKIMIEGEIEPAENYTIKRLLEYPSGRVDISKTAKLKIYTRKVEHRFDEMFILDVAVLARTNESIYFPADLDVNLIIKDKSGNRVRAYSNLHIDYFPHFTKSKEVFIVRREKLLIGCKDLDAPANKAIFEAMFSDDMDVAFENNAFATIDYACIDVKNADELEISAELTNDYVLIPKNKENIKTAIGSLKSNSIKLIIKD